MTIPSARVRFGVFEVDLRSGELHKQGIKIKLHDQPFQVLAMLLEHPGQLVTREELHLKLWPANTFVDFDVGLNSAIKRLRDALGDSAEDPRFVETLPRRGYRFIAPVEGQKTPQPGEPSAEVTGRPRGQAGPTSTPWRRLLLPALLALTLVAVFFSSVRAWRGYSGGSRIRSLAVLPLENLSGDPSQEYFADGMTEELTTNLAKIKSLRVISRSSAMQYKKTQKPLAEIARALRVDAVVEGSVARSGDKVRITAQLIEARTDQHVWAEVYNRDLRDVVTLQGEVARDIAQKIRIAVTPEERAQLTGARRINPEAYEAYLKGRYYWNKRTEEAMRRAIPYFEQSMSKDPNYPLAHDGLADCWLSLGWYGYVSPKEAFPRGKAAAMRALELDDSLAEAHTSLAFASMNYDWDWPAAEREFRKAIELNPNYANAHHWYGDYLSAVGQHEQAIAESRRALELDPLSPIINAWLGWRYYFARQFDKAIDQYRETLEIDSNFVPVHLVLGQAYEQKGMLKEAIAELEKASSLSKGAPLYASSLAHAYAVAGRRNEAETMLHQADEHAQHAYVPSFHVAIMYAGLGRKDETIAWLERGYQERSAWMVWLKVDPRFDFVRSDARFQNLLLRLGFPIAPAQVLADAKEKPHPRVWYGEAFGLQEMREGNWCFFTFRGFATARLKVVRPLIAEHCRGTRPRNKSITRQFCRGKSLIRGLGKKEESLAFWDARGLWSTDRRD
jgi:TolB-like protein/DNA-binding winged helix-turn-helix (wHTH) protein/Flp pilus assembly protein TadD